MRVDVRPTEDLAPDTRARIIRVCVAAHDEPDFQRLFSYIPSGGRHFLAYDGESLVSHAVVTTRWLRPQSARRLRTAYVDAVATLPTHQRRGHASAVMRALGSNVADYDIGCLETESPAFYERLGWEVWRGPLGGIGERGEVPTPNQGKVMVLRLPTTPALDVTSRLLIEIDGGRVW